MRVNIGTMVRDEGWDPFPVTPIRKQYIKRGFSLRLPV